MQTIPKFVPRIIETGHNYKAVFTDLDEWVSYSGNKKVQQYAGAHCRRCVAFSVLPSNLTVQCHYQAGTIVSDKDSPYGYRYIYNTAVHPEGHDIEYSVCLHNELGDTISQEDIWTHKRPMLAASWDDQCYDRFMKSENSPDNRGLLYADRVHDDTDKWRAIVLNHPAHYNLNRSPFRRLRHMSERKALYSDLLSSNTSNADDCEHYFDIKVRGKRSKSSLIDPNDDYIAHRDRCWKKKKNTCAMGCYP